MRMKMKRFLSIFLSITLMLVMVLEQMPGMRMKVQAADNVSTYTLQIPSMLNVSAVGWNETSGLTAAVTENDTFDSGKKLSVTASSANSWALKSGDNTVGYNLAKATGTYSSSATPVSWEFTAAELNTSGGTNKAMGIIVDDYSEKPAGTYQDTVTFMAKVETAAAAAPTLTLGEMTQGGDPMSGGSGSGTYYAPTFSAGQQVAVIYKNTSGNTVKVLTDALTASDISNEGKSATINVTIDDADKTQPVTYIYPATMGNEDYGSFNFTAQSGTEASLSTVRNCCKGSGDWDGDALPSVSMDSQQAIVKLILENESDNSSLNASSLTVSAASNKLVTGKGFISKSTTHSGYTYDGGTSSMHNAPSSQLVDGKKTSSDGSKWCTSTGDKVDGIWYCEFHTASAVQVNGYTITTGDDNSSWKNRNPKDWVLKAKADAGDSWTTIATVTNDATLKDENYKPFDFNVDVPGIYQYFRFEVSANQGDGDMQIEELELFKSDYDTAYGDLTVTPASATSEIFVALRNENGGADTYTLSANVGGKRYAFSKSGVTFQNGKYYEITVKMTEQAASTVEWIFSEMSEEHPDLHHGGYTYKDVTLSGAGDLNFEHGMLYAMGDLTFTAPSGKHFKSIVINATMMANISGTGWTNDMEPGNWTSTWTGDASSVTFSGMADGVTSIVFTLE